MSSSVASRFSNFFVNFFSFTGQLVPQQEAEQSIRDGVSFKGTNIVILILAILSASLGLNTNSTAVIIGAMLISPLMGPIIGCGLGIGVRDFDLIKRSLRNLIMAAGFSVIASTIYFLISPVNEQHSELLARTSPTIYDVLIGFVGGGAGILAIASRSKGNVIPGVAIATALMPPLCTAGYGLATAQFTYFFGAFYLFIINSIYIAFSTFIGVKLMRYQPVDTANPERSRRVMKWVYSLAILTMLPSIYLTINMLRANKLNVEIERFVNDECRFPQTQVLSKKLYTDNGQRYLQLTLIGQTLPVDSLIMALEPRMRYYDLGNLKLEFLQGGVASSVRDDASESNLRDFYQITQSTITRQQSAIDSLRTLIGKERAAAATAVEIAPEIRVLFPQVSDIAVSRTVFAATAPSDAHMATDTAVVAMVYLAKPLTRAELKRFNEYLCARLSVPAIDIIPVSKP